MRIALDVMGGDFGPEPAVNGAVQALQSDSDIRLILVGDQDQIEAILPDLGDIERRVEFEHTTEVVGMDESPAQAIKKRNSSIFRCWQLLAAGRVDGIVSAGNTGAVWAAGLRTRRFLRNIRRPAIAVTIPTAAGCSVMLDVGANTHPKPSHLFQYGVMGSIFARSLLGRDKPRIALLNVGSEESKGNVLAKETATLFLNSPMREQFHGNIEGRDLWHGVVDVIVCDGFVGNIVLKTCEGILEFLMKAVGQELMGALNAERDLAKQALLGLYNRYHHSEFGGAPLLGIDGVCLICHGASDAKAFRNAIKRAKSFNEVNRLIVREMESALAGMEVGANI
jgi:glycerol-3-phosphate acyltransferase PlsX